MKACEQQVARFREAIGYVMESSRKKPTQDAARKLEDTLKDLQDFIDYVVSKSVLCCELISEKSFSVALTKG